MFNPLQSRQVSRQDIYVRPLLPAVLVFLAFMAIVGLSWRTAKHDIKTQTQNIVNEDASFIESTIKQRFNIYETTLRAGSGLFKGSDSVTRSEWTGFVNSLDLTERYPGIRSVGFVKIITNDEKAEFIANIQENDLPSYNLHPDSTSAVYAPLLYSVPTAGQALDDRNSPVLGFDMYSDPPRQSAMDIAAASGEPTFTSLMELASANNSTKGMQGFLLFLPLYKDNMPISTNEERKAALDGFFYAPFLTGDVFANVFHVPQPAFAFSIFDGKPGKQNYLYKSSNNYSNPDYHEIKRTTLSLYGQEWTVVYKASIDIVPKTVKERPSNALIGGVIFSFSLAAVIYLLIQRRTRSLAYSEQKRLEAAKDDLLSLASHQLRTPATAVKQYISMLRDGFAGKLSADQSNLLKRAYDSNERQLTIVDDLLYVARIDAGQTSLRIEDVNLSRLIRSVVADQRSVIKNRKQAVNIKLPRREIHIEADPQYLRMIVENLLSNASKYSHEHKKIVLELTSTRQDIELNVVDHGVGIAPENYGDVFVRFNRIPNELTRQITGSGIGLYLAKQLALLHKGDITFTSVLHRGTTFTLTLPKKQPKK